jgi:hypothetical protein
MEQQSSGVKPARTFWQRPEGTAGKGIIVALTALLGVAFVHFLPALISLAENTLYLAGLIGTIAMLYCMVFVWDRPRTLLFYALQMISRWVTGNFVELDPVAILKSFVRQMEKRREVIADRLGSIVGVRRQVEAKIARSEKERQDALRLARAAQGSGDDDGLNAHAEIAARRARDIEEYQGMKAQMFNIEQLLQRMMRRADYHIQTARDEANQLADKHAITGAVKSATAAARGIFGDSDLAEVRDMAADRIREDYEARLGELQTFIDLTDFDHAVDLNQMAFRQEGLAQLQEAEKKVAAAEERDPSGSRGFGSTQEASTVSSAQEPASVWRSKLRRP